jgi:hypothetical protein
MFNQDVDGYHQKNATLKRPSLWVIAGASHSKWVQIERNESLRLKGVLKNRKDEMKLLLHGVTDQELEELDILVQH